MYIKQLKFLGEITSDFPYNLPFLNSLNDYTFTKNVTFITGENGSGKSTFLEAVALLCGLNAEGGSKSNVFSTFDSTSSLYETCRLVRYPAYPKDAYFYRAESFYNLISDLDELGVSEELFDKELHGYSRGEAFKNLLKNRFFGQGFYLLDEPETGLSLQSQLEVLILLQDLVQAGSQFIICTHSPILLLFPDADIWEFGTEGIQSVAAKDSFIIEQWQMILQRKSAFIEQLLQE